MEGRGRQKLENGVRSKQGGGCEGRAKFRNPVRLIAEGFPIVWLLFQLLGSLGSHLIHHW